MERKSHKVLGYDVDLLTFDEAVKQVLENIKNKQGMQIVTVNPEMIELANKSKAYATVLKNADMVVPDGSGIKLALKLQGIKQEQIPGIDLAHELITSCEIFNYSIALIGARENVIQTTVRRLKSEFEGINICYYKNGYFSSSKEDEIINSLAESEPQLVLVALGAPKQEIFITKCRKKIPEAVFIGVGGAFDVWAGEVERAPEFFRIMGCEWLYRTIRQPERIKRIYKTLPMFLIKAIIEAAKKNG